MGTPEDAAIRETREEFGINIADIIPVTLVNNPVSMSPLSGDRKPQIRF